VKNIVHSWFAGKSCASLLALAVNILIGGMAYAVLVLSVIPLKKLKIVR
jgi:hypothetical protein